MGTRQRGWGNTNLSLSFPAALHRQRERRLDLEREKTWDPTKKGGDRSGEEKEEKKKKMKTDRYLAQLLDLFCQIAIFDRQFGVLVDHFVQLMLLWGGFVKKISFTSPADRLQETKRASIERTKS